VQKLALMLAGVRGRGSATMLGDTAEALVGVAADDYLAILGRVGTVWGTTSGSWGEGTLRLQRLCVQFEQMGVDAAARAGAGGAPSTRGGYGAAGWEGEEERTTVPSSTSERATAASVIRILGHQSVVTAEAAAVKVSDPRDEVRRIVSHPEYGHAAAAFIFSDGTCNGKLPSKGALGC
jgi:hypothetical protein